MSVDSTQDIIVSDPHTWTAFQRKHADEVKQNPVAVIHSAWYTGVTLKRLARRSGWKSAHLCLISSAALTKANDHCRLEKVPV